MGLWLAEAPLVLASQSNSRRMLLIAAGVPVDVQPANLDERAVEARAGERSVAALSPGAAAALLAREKAIAVAHRFPGRLVLGADQTLSLGGKRFTKPTDRNAARAQLRALCGHSHELHSAIAFVQHGNVLFEHVGEARLTMRSFSEAFLDRYLDVVGASATDSVGAYQIEGIGMQLFKRIDGDYFTILGLPLLPALDFLRSIGCLAQ